MKGICIHQQLHLYIIMYSNMKWDKRLLLSDNWCRFCEHSHDATIGNVNRRQNSQNARKFCPRCVLRRAVSPLVCSSKYFLNKQTVRSCR